jgi:membrane associated rhomboid family serine protease
MQACPRCETPLGRVRGPQGVYWSCAGCGGRAVTLPLLRRLLVRPYINQIWQYAKDEKGVRRRPCPLCRQLMIDVPVVYGAAAHWIDVCTGCQLVWFDPREYEEAPAMAAPAGEVLSPRAREALAKMEVKRVGEREAGEGGEIEAWWHLLPALLGAPVETDVDPVRARPWATWTLAGLVTVVSVLAFADLPGAVRAFGLIPAEAMRYGGLTFLSSAFLHDGFLHLAGTMYFLLIFGDNVEDFLGRRRYLLLLAAAALAGGLLHVLGDPHASVPCIGASGAISGVIACYALRFPRARLTFFWWFLVYVRRFTLSARTAFVLWLLLQAVLAGMQREGLSNVSALAHVGGAAAGAACWALWRKSA